MGLPDFGPRNPAAPTDPTKPPPAPPYADQNRPGHWTGNQWIYNDIIADPTQDPNNPGHFVGGNWQYDDPARAAMSPDERAAADAAKAVPPPPATTPATTTTPPASSSSAGGKTTAAPPPPSTTISDTYRDIFSQLLGSSAPSATPYNAVTPTRTPVDLNLPPKSDYDQLVHDQIVKMLGGPTAEEAGQAAAHSVPVSAYRNSILRDLGVQQAGAAEQSGLSGTQGSGGMAGQQEALRQAAGEKTATFTGNYVDKAMADRRAELQQAMTMAQQQGNFEDQQALAAELARLNMEEERYKNDLSLYGTNVNAQLQSEQNANQRYATEVQKLLGMSDVELRRYLGDITNATNRYGIDSTANTNADRLGFDYLSKYLDQVNKWIDGGMQGPKPVMGG
jgi:hypothetical protein